MGRLEGELVISAFSAGLLHGYLCVPELLVLFCFVHLCAVQCAVSLHSCNVHCLFAVCCLCSVLFAIPGI